MIPKHNFRAFVAVAVVALLAVTGHSAEKTKQSKPETKKAPAKAKAPAKPAKPAPPAKYPFVGSIERLDPKFDTLIATNAVIERLSEGFKWAEGPVWMNGGLLFSDIPANSVYRWDERHGVSLFLKPSGYTGHDPREGEQGSNGLTRDRAGRLVLCQHGDRRIVRMDAKGTFTPVAEFYKWHRFNSPNDLVYKANGDLYFTDPPYGMTGRDNELSELIYQGVYRAKPDGQVDLLTAEMSRPNGIAFSPDEKTLYVANSDSKNPVLMAFPVKPDGKLGEGKVFFDGTELSKIRPGAFDGMKVDRAGNLFATGPGGILVISPQGKHLGTILTGVPTANCAWGDNGATLYITANKTICRIQTLTKGKL